MAALKDEISADMVARLGEQFARAWPAFDRARFEALAVDGLADRELKARIRQIAHSLVATMPDDPAQSSRVVHAVLANGGLEAWASLPVADYVALALLDHPDIALPLLAALTPNFSAEFAIRPFIETHPSVTMAQLHAWTTDPDEHVRRLVSEGTRPRLPWAPVLRSFIADPTPSLPLLDRLFDDDAEYVRRSVANHLNDISKDHPELAVEVAARWLAASTHGDYVARHSLRTLIKAGHMGALAVLGFGSGDSIDVVEFVCDPTSVPIGGSVTFRGLLRATSETRAMIDYRVHYQGAKGLKAPKVFKLATRELAADQPVSISRSHSFQHVSIRRIRPGPHRIDLQVNGQVLASADIEVYLDE